jgi:sec-independent protein translocase protein TatB
MPQIGPLEILVVAVVALIVFGPQRLPEIARTLGRTLNEFRRQAADIRAEFESGMGDMSISDEPEYDANKAMASGGDDVVITDPDGDASAKPDGSTDGERPTDG